MAGARAALLVVNSVYDDDGLRRLRAPGADAAALGEVLADGSVGSFHVDILEDEPAQSVRTAIEAFFADRAPDDLLLLHFSCHGVKSADGRLFLAHRDTKPKLLASTGVPAEFVNDQMASSRAQRIALFLDCCYGGAFPRGLVGRAGDDAHIGDNFRDIEDESSGRGRVVVTASSAMQYSFEAGALAADEVQPSLFTGALVEALSTGEADRDGDGWVGLTELFTFVRNQVRRLAPDQTPQMWTYGASGEILLARSRVRRIIAAELDPEVTSALRSPLPSTRLGQIDLLREWALGADLPTALAAWHSLDKLTRDDSEKVRSAVARVQAEGALGVNPQTLHMSTGNAETVLSLSGPPLARAITVTADNAALRIEYDDHQVRVATTGGAESGHEALLTVTSPTGSVDVTVVVTEATGEESSSVAVDVTPAPSEASLAEDTAFLEALPAEGRRGTRRRVVTALVAAVVVAAVGVTAGRITRGSDDGPVNLPQGSRLPDEDMVWVASSPDRDAIKAGLPGGRERRLVPPTTAMLRYPSISPDRRTVAFLRVSETEGGELYVVGTDGTGERQIGPSTSCPNQGRPSWSPDGNQLATICFAQDGSRLGVAVLALDGSVHILTHDPMATTPDWSPAGEVVVYASSSPSDLSGPSDLRAVPVDGGGPRQLTEGNSDHFPAVDPTGEWVAFTRFRGDTGSLFKLDIGSRAVTPLTSPTRGKDIEPAWSPDGRTVAFQRRHSVALVPASGDGRVKRLSAPDAVFRHMIAWQ